MVFKLINWFFYLKKKDMLMIIHNKWPILKMTVFISVHSWIGSSDYKKQHSSFAFRFTFLCFNKCEGCWQHSYPQRSCRHTSSDNITAHRAQNRSRDWEESPVGFMRHQLGHSLWVKRDRRAHFPHAWQGGGADCCGGTVEKVCCSVPHQVFISMWPYAGTVAEG